MSLASTSGSGRFFVSSRLPSLNRKMSRFFFLPRSVSSSLVGLEPLGFLFITAVRRIVEVEEVGQVLARHQIMPECEVIVDPEVVNSESGLVLWVVLAGFRLKKRTLTSTACA